MDVLFYILPAAVVSAVVVLIARRKRGEEQEVGFKLNTPAGKIAVVVVALALIIFGFVLIQPR